MLTYHIYFFSFSKITMESMQYEAKLQVESILLSSKRPVCFAQCFSLDNFLKRFSLLLQLSDHIFVFSSLVMSHKRKKIKCQSFYKITITQQLTGESEASSGCDKLNRGGVSSRRLAMNAIVVRSMSHSRFFGTITSLPLSILGL